MTAPSAPRAAALARLLRKPICWLRMCPCAPYEDAGGVGGQCIFCGKIAGYVTRAELRAYADRDWAARAARDAGEGRE